MSWWSVLVGAFSSPLAVQSQSDTHHEANLRRMNTSVKLNAIIRERSEGADLVLLNLPGVPDDVEDSGTNYMEFLEVCSRRRPCTGTRFKPRVFLMGS